MSGIVHDTETGRKVNIAHSDDDSEAEDVYSYFIDIIKSRLNLESNERIRKFKIDRKLLKPIIKTIPYSATVYGKANDLSHEFEEDVVYTELINSLNQEKFTKKTTKFKTFDTENKEVILTRKDLMQICKIIKSEILKKCNSLDRLKSYFTTKGKL